MLKFALAGNPNCGKTTLFNSLTGSTAHVGNWPGVTVDKKEGTYKKLAEPISIVDLPGIYSLSPYTPEEVISRNYILDEKPDCVINIVDATNLERNLYLTTQVMEIDVPVVIALNMMDEVNKIGDKIDAKTLQQKIGIPVVPISALKDEGLDELMQKAYAACKTPRKGNTVLEDTSLMHLIGDCKIALEGQGVENTLFHAIKLVELDELEVQAHPTSAQMVEEFKKTFKNDTFGGDFEAIVADSRYKYITKYFSSVLTKKVLTEEERQKANHSQKIDKVLTHKIWSIPIFLLIMFLIFHLTFSQDLFYLGAMGVFDGNEAVSEQVVESNSQDGDLIGEFASNVSINTIFGYKEGIYSPGVVLFSAVDTLTGFLSTCAKQWLANSSASEWVTGFVVDGVLGGLFAVISFLPQILLLFLFFSLLEDSGYMARVAFILDRIFRKLGLSGRAFMPMIMGFGCSVPAMINTRTLADQNERTTTIRVIPFFSCGAKLPILTAIAGGIIQILGTGNADLITYSMYLIGILTAFVCIILFKSTAKKSETPPFIMELPMYHMPRFLNLMMHLWDKAKHFLQKAFTIILASTVVIWVISHFTFNWEYLADEDMDKSILAGLGGLVQPLFTPLGFGSQLKAFGWVFVVASITGLIAKENVIATLGTLAACVVGSMIDIKTDGGVAAVSALANATGITVPALLAFVAFNMTTIPCFATVATARAELPTKKSYVLTLVFWMATSFVVSGMIYTICSWWWTVFVWVLIAALAIVAIKLNNKRNAKKEKKQC